MYLLDINVWLALTFVVHSHHQPARAWFDRLSTESRCYFCRFTQQGYLRLATNPKVFPDSALTAEKAWEAYDLLLRDLRVSFAVETPEIDAVWRQISIERSISSGDFSDAYLAAFAVVSDFELVTFDRGFSRFVGLSTVMLS